MSTQTYSQSYAYDRYGNRTQSANATLSLPAVSTSDYDTTNNNNRFVSSVATYDLAGNITADAKFRSLTYAYDANGRQTSASNGTWTLTQVYDCAGQRVQTTVGSSTRTMVYEASGQNVAEYSGSTLEREHIYRAGGLLAIYEAGASALRYVLTDVQGSTRAVLNSNGTVMARHDYLPFGEEIVAGIGLRSSGQGFGATDPNRQTYGLTERDGTTGLDHTWWRKYENVSGRWTSPDPLRGAIGAPQSFNAYTYSGNDPVNFIDPTGLTPEIFGGLLGNIVGIGPGTSMVMVPIGWGDPIARHGGSSGDGTEWVTLAVIDPRALNQASAGPQKAEPNEMIHCDPLVKKQINRMIVKNYSARRGGLNTDTGVEFGFIAYRDGSGNIAVTEIAQGDHDSVEVPPPPAGSVWIAFFHTHPPTPPNMTGFGNAKPSDADRNASIRDKNITYTFNGSGNYEKTLFNGNNPTNPDGTPRIIALPKCPK